MRSRCTRHSTCRVAVVWFVCEHPDRPLDAGAAFHWDDCPACERLATRAAA